MTIYFHNPGTLDLDTIRLMGVSVKPDSENPIGYFGTGLKFAIATLLRTGHEITLTTAGTEYVFRQRSQSVRGQDFGIVYMNDEKLGFTTELGKNWKPWMAFRELHSNALDEGGSSATVCPEADTIIAVSGVGIEEAYRRRSQIFLETKPLWTFDNIEVHPGSSNIIFYRGVTALKREKPYAFTYNIKKEMSLTEDRFLKSEFLADWEIREAIESTSAQLPFLQELFVHRLNENNFRHMDLTNQMYEAARPHLHDVDFNSTIRELCREKAGQDEGHPAVQLSPFEELEVHSAVSLVQRLDPNISRSDFTITESLGSHTYGVYNRKRDEIYIARAAVDRGARFLASTIYEEWLHKTHGFIDETRPFQDFLLDRVIALTARLPEE